MSNPDTHKKMNPIFLYIQEKRALAKIEKIKSCKGTKIDLRDYDLSTLPEALLQYARLKILNVGHNSLENFPQEGTTKLRNLQHLSLEQNNFNKFPIELSALPTLKSLNISRNNLRDLRGVGSLINLETLWCNSCLLEKLPKELGALQNLDTFGARHNYLTILPNEALNLSKLRWLTLEDNQINTLPSKLPKLLTNLVHLNLGKNSFTYLPLELASLKRLRFLHMQYNLLSDVSRSVLNLMPQVKVNLEGNPLDRPKSLARNFANVIVSGVDDDLYVDSDSSSEDWDNSLDSSDLNESGSESDLDHEDFLVEIPRLSKYLVTF